MSDGGSTLIRSPLLPISALFLVFVMLFGCARTTSSATSSPATRDSADVAVGFVRMDVLLKSHPLYSELARLDADVSAMEWGSDAPQIAQEAQAVRQDMQSAEERTRKELAERQTAFIRQENKAIAEILRQGEVPAQSAQVVEGQIAQTSREQVKTVDDQARKNFQEYRLKIIAQSAAALSSMQQSFLDRADRAYRMRADEYAQKEAAFSYEQARKNAIERLLLRARLADMAPDKQTRVQLQARLDALGKQEIDEQGALHKRDQTDLSFYQRQLYDDRRTQESRQAEEMQVRTNAKLSESARQTQVRVLGQLGTVTVPPPLLMSSASVLPPTLREKLDALHRRYQAAYAEDAARIVRQFTKTAEELSARFDRLAGVDAVAQEGARKEIEGLRKQREDLYDQMIAQIDREVKAVAERRGIRTVLTKVVVSSGGVDLTHAAAEDIEGLHE